VICLFVFVIGGGGGVVVEDVLCNVRYCHSPPPTDTSSVLYRGCLNDLACVSVEVCIATSML
jgi:hypothetical protein